MEPLTYSAFLMAKAQHGGDAGFKPQFLPDFLFDFQKSLVEWSVRKGTAAIFADCGMGKTPMQLVWAENVVRHTGKRVLIATPLAVSHQTLTEGAKFGIECRRSMTGELHDGITITNYERLHYFNPADFIGMVADESSILKSFDGAIKSAVTEFMRKLPYRLLCTATAAPNDYIELGTSSEALGELGYMDMLNRFFKNDQNTSNPNRLWDGAGWRFKGHAEQAFWRWVSSWARALRRPSDLGYSDDGFLLPPLQEVEHVVEARTVAPGMLFSLPAVGLKEQRDERRRTIEERCEEVARLTDTKQPALVWCHLNEEGDILQRLVRDCVQVAGADPDEKKEEAFLAFARGEIRALVTKPKIGAWGLNFQHCSHVTFFPSHSFEQYYQGVRRCWRYGQKRPVRVDVVTTEGERGVLANLRRKADAADKMFSSLVAEMNSALRIERSSRATIMEALPAWL